MGWFYGGSNLAQVIKLKISKTLGCFFPLSWIFFTPMILLSILTWSAVSYEEPLFRQLYRFPMIMHCIVVGIAIVLMLLIPMIGYNQVTRTPRHESFINRILLACKPFEHDAPSVPLVEEDPSSLPHNYSHGHEPKEPSPPSTNRRPSILTQDWSKINLNPFSTSSSRKQSSSSSCTKNNNQDQGSRQPFLNGKEDIIQVPITLSLIQGLDRETDL